MLWLMLACGQSDKNEDSAIEFTFENEETYSLGEEESGGYYQVSLDLVSGFLLPFDAPADTYEIVELTIDVYTGADNCTSAINLFAIAAENPVEISELTDYFLYEGLAPYAFPDIPNSRHAVLPLTSESNHSPSNLDNNANGYEFSLRFDSPLLVEDNTPFWVGFGLHEGERTCLTIVETSTPEGFGYIFVGNEFSSISGPNEQIIKMRAKVRY